MSEAIKVLRIMGPVISGGVDIITMNYYRNIDSSKVQLDFVFDGFHETSIEREIETTGGKVYKVESYKNNIFKNMYQIYRIVKDNNYKIVHSHMNSLSVFPLMASRIAGAKIRIASNHSTANIRELKKTLIKYLLKPFATIFPTNLAACSNHAAVWLFGKKKTNLGQVKIIKNAINLDDYKYNENISKDVKTELGISDEFVVGHVGRFATQKNHKFIISIFKEIVKEHPNSVLLLVGDGPLKKIKDLVVDEHLETKIKFLGIRKDVNRLMQAFDVFIFPSLYEGFGNVITEAQASSTESIVSEKIPDEVRLTDYVTEMKLHQTSYEWAKEALKYSNGYNRKDTNYVLRKEGYDIKYASDELVEYYQNLYFTIQGSEEVL